MNSKVFGLAVFLACSTLGTISCTAGPARESTGEYMDDTVITGKVKAAILQDEVLKVTEINVETFKGVVQLSGFVSSRADADRAVALTRTIGGVKSVKHDMQIK